MARAPLLLSESMLFPYREGLSFEQDVWMDQGQAAAFAGRSTARPPQVLGDHQSARIREQAYPAVPLLPDIHPARRSALQALRHRPGGPARRAHSLRALRRRQCGARPYSCLERRPLLGRAIAQRQDPGGTGQHQVARLFYLSLWKKTALAASIRTSNQSRTMEEGPRLPTALTNRSSPPARARW
jgi:hypothetical protein